MDKIFTKDFIKFLLGFTLMIAVTLALVFVMQSQAEKGIDGSGTQTLPATTTVQ